jgi:hypothetical protein
MEMAGEIASLKRPKLMESLLDTEPFKYGIIRERVPLAAVGPSVLNAPSRETSFPLAEAPSRETSFPLEQEQSALKEEKHRLKERLKEIDKELYELEPKEFTVTDEHSGRTFKLKRNPYELSIEYPKVHPVTGQRLYGKTEHWTGKGFNSIATTMDTNFPDKECVKDKEIFDGYYKLYHARKGWSKHGYYWNDVSSDYEPVHYVEIKIPKDKKK